MLLSEGVGEGADEPEPLSGCCLPFLSVMVEVDEARDELLLKGLRWVFASLSLRKEDMMNEASLGLLEMITGEEDS